MSLVAGLFLIVMGSEETAFWCLVSVMERGKYLLGYYDSHMERYELLALAFLLDTKSYYFTACSFDVIYAYIYTIIS